MALIDSKWYALQVRPKAETLVATNLCYEGYEVFLPKLKAPRLHRRLRSSSVPMFPGYVFCRHSDQIRKKMVEAQGVIRIVSFNRQPMPVDEAELDSVRILCRSGISIHSWQYLSEGQPIRVISGPLMGVEGAFISVSRAEFVVVNVTLLQRSLMVKLSGDSIVVTNSGSALRPT